MKKHRLSIIITGWLILFIASGRGPVSAQGFEEKAYLADLRSYNQLPLDSLWYYQPGNSSINSLSAKWTVVNTHFLRDKAGHPLAWSGVGWFRKQWRVPTGFRNRAVALRMGHFGASEIYLDGRLIQRYGKIGRTLADESIYLPRQPFLVQLNGQETHWLTIRYGNHRARLPGYDNTFSGFRLLASAPVYREDDTVEFLPMMFSICLAFMMLFGFVYVLYPARLASLFSALGLANASCLFFAVYLLNTVNEGAILIPAAYVRYMAIGIGEALFLLITYLLYYGQWPRRAWVVVTWIAVIPVLIVSKLFAVGVVLTISGLLTLERLRMLIVGVWRQKDGFLILLVGYILGQALLFGAAFDVFNWFPVFTYTLGVLLVLNGTIPPLTLALHLAWEFRTANRNLQLKLNQVECLSEQTIRQEQEKQHLLATQNEMLEQQVAVRTEELADKNRELEIESVLEKIRSRSLAMHRSDELGSVVTIMFEKLKELNVLLGTVSIVFFDEKTKGLTFWIGNELHDEPPMISVPYDKNVFDENICLKDYWQAKITGKDIVNKKYGLEEKNSYFNHVFTHNDFAVLPQPVRDFIKQAESETVCLFIEKNSTLFADNWDGRAYSEDMINVLKRASIVFEQAYVRFLDLQKAEAQTREAQIEVALERVRNRTMAMQHSDELRDVVAVIYAQLQTLEFTYGALGIVIMDKLSGDMDWWMAGFGKENYPEKYHIPFFDHPFYLAQLDAWKEEKKFAVLKVSGEQKKLYDEVIFNKTDFVRISPEAQRAMLAFDEITFSNANMKHGALSWGTNPIGSDQANTIQRFAVVFEQTYTRFLDLQKKEEQAVKLAEEKQKLEQTLTELRATQTQLIQKEKLASLGELTAGIAHEIQNPLNFVNNFAEVSAELVEELREEREKREERDEELEAGLLGDLKQNLQKITHHGGRASAIVKGMLEHSRSSTGEREPTDLNALADEYLRLAYHGLRAKDNSFNCELITDFAPDIGQVEVVPQDIGRVLLNLYNNAFYAVQQRAKTAPAECKPIVTVSTQRSESGVEIRVSDNGTGIPDAVKAKIFQPFFTTKPTGEGTGLGLSLSYDIVTKGHGGTLSVESAEGEGTMFTLKLPSTTN